MLFEQKTEEGKTLDWCVMCMYSKINLFVLVIKVYMYTVGFI